MKEVVTSKKVLIKQVQEAVADLVKEEGYLVLNVMLLKARLNLFPEKPFLLAIFSQYS